ncbi:pentatricopeptide repeat-containing protein [Tanacetum coccineum]
MILQTKPTKLTTLNLISTSLNPKPNNHLPTKITTINLPLHKPHHKPLKPIKTHKPKPITTTTPSDILRLLDTLRFPVPDAVYISLIKECAQFQYSIESVLVHTHMTKNRKKRLSLSLVNRVLIMYVSCGSLDNVRKVFDEMSKRDFNSWAIMIAGYADNGEYEQVIRLVWGDDECEAWGASSWVVDASSSCQNIDIIKLKSVSDKQYNKYLAPLLLKKEKEYLAPLAISHYREKTLYDIIDRDLWKQMDPQSFSIFAETAYDCLNEERSRRPDIGEVVTRLEKALELQLPPENMPGIPFSFSFMVLS